MDVLKRRGWTSVNRCFLCKGEKGSCDQILLHCSKASLLWLLVFSLFGVVWLLHTSIQATLLSWHSCTIKKRRKMAWNVTPLCLFWIIWKEKNRRAFENVQLSNEELKFSFCVTF